MDITFRTHRIGQIMCSSKELVLEYGKENATLIKRRMAFLEAAPCLADVPAERPCRRHQLKGRLAGYFAVDVKHPFRLIFRPTNEPLQYKSDGGLDLVRVTAIEIFGVEDYH